MAALPPDESNNPHLQQQERAGRTWISYLLGSGRSSTPAQVTRIDQAIVSNEARARAYQQVDRWKAGDKRPRENDPMFGFSIQAFDQAYLASVCPPNTKPPGTSSTADQRFRKM